MQDEIPLHKSWRTIVVVAALASLAASVMLALQTFGTNDVLNYERFAVWSHYLGASLYRASLDFDPGQMADFPPSMIWVLRFLEWMTQITGLPFQFWLRVPGILANAGSVWLLSRLLAPRYGSALALFAIAPPLILIAGFHGNTDTIMIFLVLLTVWLADRNREYLAGAAFGLSIGVKVVPLMLVPVMYFAWPTLRKKLGFFAAAGLALLIGSSPFIFQEPAAIAKDIFGYRSGYGVWGVSWLASLADVPALDHALGRYGPWLIFGALIAVSVRMNYSPRRPSLFSQVGMIFVLFLACATGFGVQYLAWLVPWIVELGILPLGLYCLTSSVFLVLVYNSWTQGTPWYLALGYPWAHLQYFQAICWLSVVGVACIAWRSLSRGQPFRLPGSRATQAVALSALAAIFLLWPMARQLSRDVRRPVPAYGEEAVLAIQADYFSDLSAELQRRGRTAEASDAEREARSLKSRSDRMAAATAARFPNNPPVPE